MIATELGLRIKELRRQTGMGQEKFALKIDMDRTYFASVEMGKRNISLRNNLHVVNPSPYSYFTVLSIICRIHMFKSSSSIAIPYSPVKRSYEMPCGRIVFQNRFPIKNISGNAICFFTAPFHIFPSPSLLYSVAK